MHGRSETLLILALSASQLSVSLTERTQRCRVGQDGNRLLQRFEIVHGQEHRGGASMDRHRDPFVFRPGTRHQLGKMSLGLCYRPDLRHSHKYDHYSTVGQEGLSRTERRSPLMMACFGALPVNAATAVDQPM